MSQKASQHKIEPLTCRFPALGLNSFEIMLVPLGVYIGDRAPTGDPKAPLPGVVTSANAKAFVPMTPAPGLFATAPGCTFVLAKFMASSLRILATWSGLSGAALSPALPALHLIPCTYTLSCLTSSPGSALVAADRAFRRCRYQQQQTTSSSSKQAATTPTMMPMSLASFEDVEVPAQL